MKIPISFRIYIVGLLQAALSVVAFIVGLVYALRANPGLDEKTVLQFAADETVRAFETPETAGPRITTVASGLFVRVRVSDAQGAPILEAPVPDMRQCPAELAADGVVVREAGISCLVQHAEIPGRGQVRIEIGRVQLTNLLTQLVIMFAVIFAAGSLLLGRHVGAPLRHMAEIARSFGRGQTSARVKLKRRDEVGEVAGAFDEMADQIVHMRRTERELLANVSHELRTPLARIRFALELAEGDAKSETARWRTDIAEDLDELETMISDILTAARMELSGGPSGLSPLRIEEVPIEDVIEKATSRFTSAHPERPLDVALGTPGLAIQVDPVQLRRAIGNLLENSHKYSPEPTSMVLLTAETTEEMLRIQVRDHGIGIADADQERLFQPFFRVDRSRSRSTGGLGLGLLLVRRIAEAHGGTATIESAPGQGTTATIEIPLS